MTKDEVNISCLAELTLDIFLNTFVIKMSRVNSHKQGSDS